MDKITSMKKEQKFIYTPAPGLKPLSEVEKKRAKETSDMIVRHLYATPEGEGKSEYCEYYDIDGEDVFTQELGIEYGTRPYVEAVISKNYIVYAKSHDENWKSVKKGKRVPGTVYYSVGIDSEILDENVLGYKTFKDAKHALELVLDYMKQRSSWYKNVETNYTPEQQALVDEFEKAIDDTFASVGDAYAKDTNKEDTSNESDGN